MDDLSLVDEMEDRVVDSALALGDRATVWRSFADTATRGMIDAVGGLVQATCGDLAESSDRALAIGQLKRALKSHAYCHGAIFGLRGANHIDDATSDRFHDELQAILESIRDLMAAAWDE